MTAKTGHCCPKLATKKMVISRNFPWKILDASIVVENGTPGITNGAEWEKRAQFEDV